ncbi:MAG TPA: RpiB/LacA/LacB family sugar-phosphate isomerase [Trebonia sp.]|nr:RpiB/LacA/LacB family sugar-phosphate isomerase [Trebonia sp.]
MRIVIAADHNGVSLKDHLIERLTGEGHHVEDLGTSGTQTVDYPPLCAAVGHQVARGPADRGIVVGGSGSGEQIACNKVPGVRAGVCHDLFTTEIARAHNDANVLILGAKIIAPDLAWLITSRWLATPFKGGRHQDRLDQIAALERGELLPLARTIPGRSKHERVVG